MKISFSSSGVWVTGSTEGKVWRYKMVVPCKGTQFRFSLSSGALTTRLRSQSIDPPTLMLFIGLLVLAHLMLSCASCLLPSHPRCCSWLLCLFFLCRSLPVLQLLCCVTLSTTCLLLWASTASFIQPIFCSAYWDSFLCCACWNSVSGFPNLRLASTACWDSVSSFLGLWLGNYILSIRAL